MVSNCEFLGNSGGYGGAITACQSVSALVTDCIFDTNNAGTYAGAIFCDSEFVIMINNCLFINNTAQAGGAVASYDGSPVITNCTFSANQGVGGTGSGGAFYSRTGGTPFLTDCILWGNTAPSNPQIYAGVPTIVAYSDVEGGYAGLGNINADPMFITGPNGNYYLFPTSPCVNVGSGTAAALGMDLYTTQINGMPDIVTVDMGYHYPIP